MLRSCFKIPGEFPSASENVSVKAGEPARILKIRVGLTNADRRFCSRAKTAGDFKTASYLSSSIPSIDFNQSRWLPAIRSGCARLLAINPGTPARPVGSAGSL